VASTYVTDLTDKQLNTCVQVQRCAEDKGVLVTTYEGTHNHQLPPAAAAMAKTTSAAAATLLSGPAVSRDAAGALFDHNGAAPAPPLFHSPAYAMGGATLSASAPFPTITLDLTHSPPSPAGGLLQHRPTSAVPTLPFPMYGFPGHRPPMLPPPPPLQTSMVGTDARSQSALEAMTAAITSDPNFTAVLAKALSSIMAGGTEGASRGGGAGEVGGDGNGEGCAEATTAAAGGARETALRTLLQRLHESRH
jgi:hypothetical protein